MAGQRCASRQLRIGDEPQAEGDIAPVGPVGSSSTSANSSGSGPVTTMLRSAVDTATAITADRCGSSPPVAVSVSMSSP
jgi:hypothetical protein